MRVRVSVRREAIEVATEPLGVEKCIEQLQELYEWLSNLYLHDGNDLYALNAGIEVLKLVRG